jgi:hypothetical protein
MLNVEDSNIVGCRDNGPVVGMWHKLDGEDVGTVPCHDRRSQAELRRRGFGVVGVDVDAMVI